MIIHIIILIIISSCSRSIRGRADYFRIDVALAFFASETHEIIFSATPNFRLIGVALRIRCGAREIILKSIIQQGWGTSKSDVAQKIVWCQK